MSWELYYDKKKLNYMLEIDIQKKIPTKRFGVLFKGFGCPNDAHNLNDAHTAKAMPGSHERLLILEAEVEGQSQSHCESAIGHVTIIQGYPPTQGQRSNHDLQ